MSRLPALPSRPRLLFALQCAMVLAMLLVPWARAGVPHEQAVPAYAEEQTMLQLEQGLPRPGWTERESGIEHLDRHTVVPPGNTPEYGVILQRGGNSWRELRNGPLAWIVALVLLGMLAAIALHYRAVGPAEVPPPPPGAPAPPTLVRFTRWQRAVHWVVAATFVLLGLSGLVLLYGKKLILPWLGHDAFSWLAIASKWAHNIAGPLFALASVVMFVTYLRHNRFGRADWGWLLSAGGLFSKEHVDAPYFNAGEKLWFWIGVTALGLLMAATGLVLNFPYRGEVGSVAGFTRYQLQVANVLHLVGAALYLAASFGHIYLGTIGSPGAWQAMWRGRVSAAWAKQHHRLWVDDVERARAAQPREAALEQPRSVAPWGRG